MLIKIWGAEKVVESLQQIFPNADLYTLIYDEKKVGKTFPKADIHPSVFSLKTQKVYSILWKQRLCLPFMSSSVEKLDFSWYDYVIVSSSWFTHGLKTSKKTKTIIYYHAPARYMWDWTHEYRKDIGLNKWIKGFLFGRLLLKLRQWDYEAAQRNDIVLANSETTKKRVYKYFRREAQVVFPPIETSRFEKNIKSNLEIIEKVFKNDSHKTQRIIDSDSNSCSHNFQSTFSPHNYYIILSALTEFKKIDIAIENFRNIPDVNLLIIWDGDYRKNLEDKAENSKNIMFAGARYGDELVALVQNSLWLIFPGEEDFWIVPIEIMAAGKPVFALNKWWLTETVLAWKTGDFFMHADGSDFIEHFQKFHTNNLSWFYTPSDCKKQAKKYDISVFEETIKKLVQ